MNLSAELVDYFKRTRVLTEDQVAFRARKHDQHDATPEERHDTHSHHAEYGASEH